MGTTTIVNCTCASQFQDARYGVGRRVANVAKDGDGSRCTVCGAEHLRQRAMTKSVAEPEAKKGKKKQ